MRITRLSLAAYGHFTSVALDFPTPSGLHVVLGENEAGKSTALAAIEDALFGFPHRSDASWRHSPRDLRVGLTLRRDDGTQRTFWRRKGREPTLSDENGEPVGEAALSGFLGRVTRERFRRVFGLDDVGLRQGGAAILAGQGDLGESVLEVETGIAGARDALAALDRRAGALFGDRRGARAIWASVDRYRAARESLAAGSVRGPDHERLAASLDELDASMETARKEAARLNAERTVLNRVRATTPIRSALRALAVERSALGAVVRLPDDAGARREAALQERAQAERDAARVGRERGPLAERLAALRVEEALLAESGAIEEVAVGLSRIEALHERAVTLTQSVAGHRAAAVKAARALGQSGPVESVVAPSVPTRRRARALLAARPGLEGALSQAASSFEERGRALERLGEVEAAVCDMTELEQVVRRVRSLGGLEEMLDAARLRLVREADSASRAVDALPFRDGVVGELSGLVLPLEAAELASAALLHGALDAARSARRAVRQCERDAAEAADDLRATESHGAPPSRAALAALRVSRDRAFDAVLAAGGALADAYRTLVREADAAADQRADQAARVEELDRLRMASDRAGLALGRAREDEARALSALESAQADWSALWRSCLTTPGMPDEMREWRRRHADVIALLDGVEGLRREIEERSSAIRSCHAQLDAVLPDGDGTLAVRLDRAELVLERARASARVRAEHALARQAAERELARARDVLAAAREARDAWRAEWRALSAALAVPCVGEEEATLELWDDFAVAREQWEGDERDRASALETIRAFDETLARLKPLVPGAAEIGSRAVSVSVLRQALRVAEEARDERDRLAAALEGLDGEIAASSRAGRAAADTLAGLCALAGVSDESALADAIRRASEQTRLELATRARLEELRAVDDGLSLAALEDEAASVSPESGALPGRLAEIEARLAALEGEGRALLERRMSADASLRAMGERTNADASVAMQDEAASMAEQAGRYVRLRLAHALLGAGIERLRRENQDPLLAQAGALFQALTRGRYMGLAADDAEGREVMLARRADGSTCPVERLSEGTLDQLYLALRLASLERHAAGAERIPLVADDLLASFDDARARASLEVLRRFGDGNQTILFTHHGHIAAMAAESGASLHRLEVV